MQYLLSKEEFTDLWIGGPQKRYGRRVVNLIQAILSSKKESMNSQYNLIKNLLAELQSSNETRHLHHVLTEWEQTFSLFVSDEENITLDDIKDLKEC